MPIVALGLSHHSSPVTIRERFAFAETSVLEALRRLHDLAIVEEAVIVSTCNRVEVYGAAAAEAEETLAALRQFLLDYHQYCGPIDREIYGLAEPRSVEHLFKVACGLDSMVLGETEILGQLKRAYDLALRHKYTGAQLNRAFQKAFNVAKHIRSNTNIQRGSVSVASVAVELAQKVFANLEGRHVMVIGAGDTSEKTARALSSRGAAGVIVSNRSPERAEALASALGGRAVAFEQWEAEFVRIDIVVSSTSAPHYVLDRTKLAALTHHRRGRPLLLIDLAVPRDIDPEINVLENVYLYNIDDLQAIAESYLKQRQEEIDRCERIIRDKAAALVSRRSAFHLPSRSSFAYGRE